MQNWERDFHISRIVAGETPVPIGGGVYMLASPSRGVRLRASGIYRDLWMECHEEGVLTGTETTILLQARGLWMPEDESDQEAARGEDRGDEGGHLRAVVAVERTREAPAGVRAGEVRAGEVGGESTSWTT
jgi:hypothetical protein